MRRLRLNNRQVAIYDHSQVLAGRSKIIFNFCQPGNTLGPLMMVIAALFFWNSEAFWPAYLAGMTVCAIAISGMKISNRMIKRSMQLLDQIIAEVEREKRI